MKRLQSDLVKDQATKKTQEDSGVRVRGEVEEEKS